MQAEASPPPPSLLHLQWTLRPPLLSLWAPFLTTSTTLINSVIESISSVTGINEVDQSTEGGTSDGRFIAPTGSEVVEVGPLNASIHKIDEAVSIQELEMLPDIYLKVITKLLT